MALLSSLESEHLGTLREIDRRLRERRILIQGYHIDPIKGFVSVKIDVLREIRLPDEIKTLSEQGSKPLLEEVFAGLPGYIVVTDAQLKVEDLSYKGGDDGDDGRISIQTTLSIEHTYLMKDGKYVCEWNDPLNPLNEPEPLFEKKKPTCEIEQHEGVMTMHYKL